MFRLHDITRRRICRVAFFLLCVAPTVGTVVWCARRHLPGVVDTETRRLEAALGLKVSLSGLRHLRPGGVLYERLELSDPETGRLVLRCRVLEADWRQSTDRQGRPNTLLVLIASQPEIEATAIDRLGELLSRLLQSRIGTAQLDVRLAAGQLTLRCGDGAQTLTELEGSIESFAGGTQAEASFRLAGTDTTEPIRIRLIRNRQTTPPTSAFELDTGGGALPCDLLAMGLPGLEQLGARSRLRGYIWASQASNDQGSADWGGELAGQIFDVDLDDLVTDRFPHKLGGTAQLTIQSARFRGGRLEEAEGALVAGPGVISRSLIDAAATQLGLVRDAQPQGPGDIVPYEQLALAFSIDSRGLKLQGRCSAPAPGAVLVDRGGRLLSEPVLQPQPVVALLRTLVPASRHQVPATRQTDWLIGHLPVPEVVPPAGAQSAHPQARLRLRREAPQ
jgi:hypothetical protein